ncbi:MAG: M20/M25/M40 family metallo-hydrolase [Planctomycetota bacterium]
MTLLPTTPQITCRAAESLWLDAARASITTTELHGHVSVLANDLFEGREGGSRGGRAAAKYILQRLHEARVQPAGAGEQFTQNFLHSHQNLLAILPGSDPKLKYECILIGAHYDHVGYGSRRNSYGPWGYIHNGADDNASGVASVLEVIDALSQAGHQPKRSILFAFWDGEEQGLLGSKHWKNYPTVPISSVQLAINVDMVGRMTDGRIEVGGTRSAFGSRRFFSSTNLAEDVRLDFNWEYKNNSDHWTFYQAGIPSLYVHTGIHDDYHRPSDDVEKLNIDGIRTISSYLLEQVTKLADAEKLPTYRSAATRESPATQRRLETPLAALTPRIDFTWQFHPIAPTSALVRNVPWGSEASRAGLIPGDRIVSVSGRPISSDAMLPAIALQSDSPIELQVIRGASGEEHNVTLPLLGVPTKLGLSWRSDESEPHAVYVTRVVPYSPAALAGMQLHDRIYAVEGQPVRGASELLADVKRSLGEGRRVLNCLVESQGRLREVEIRLGLPTTPAGDATL